MMMQTLRVMLTRGRAQSALYGRKLGRGKGEIPCP